MDTIKNFSLLIRSDWCRFLKLNMASFILNTIAEHL